jgi:hypothetical protein
MYFNKLNSGPVSQPNPDLAAMHCKKKPKKLE